MELPVTESRWCLQAFILVNRGTAFSTGSFSTGHVVLTSIRSESLASFHTLMSESSPGQEAAQVTNFLTDEEHLLLPNCCC